MVDLGAKGSKMVKSGDNVGSSRRGVDTYQGDFTYKLDEKKRLIIPALWRSVIDNEDDKRMFVVPDFKERCLNVCPASFMETKMVKLQQLSLSDPRAMRFARRLGSSSDTVECDGQGRIKLMDKLWERIGVKENDHVVLLGAIKLFQIWNPDDRPDGDEFDMDEFSDDARYLRFI
ncbi:hypothetical protein BVX97_03430 [bacterium E08(2017)]|nr:hypothetical protein BVX97_03430 [bacterium E08(2017)]